ncbi:amidohydrolase [Flammeovirga sp. SR4]|uniref:Amidohydrolase n=1 Tax=Flammeovirga agarivorans TaxID=2726742 RepID=A0A7X8SH16_9BACT|nr:amidohydrolase [Flammeovirga agarivorans]
MKRTLTIILSMLLVWSCKTKADNIDFVLYYNGDIITMDGDSPIYAEALVESNGKIVYVGTIENAKKQYPTASKKDLQGKTLLPGFTDGHSHMAIGMQNIAFAQLSSPPVGDITSIDDIVKALKENQTKNNIPEGEWVRGWGYDQDFLAEKRHPTKEDLDKAFPNNPVFIHHVSGHMAVINSYALKLLNIDESVPDPEGGRYVRKEGGNEPTGLVQGNAVKKLLFELPKADQETKIQNFKAIQEYYASHGITTAQDGFTELEFIDFVQEMDSLGLVEMDIVTLVGYPFMEKLFTEYDVNYKEYNGHLKIAGIKIIADGSPQGKTAAMSEPYLTDVPGCSHECKGLPYLTKAQLIGLMQGAYANNAQLFVHGNGDATIDLILDSHKEAEANLQKDLSDRRTVVIHSQFMRPEQLDRYATEGFVPSFFTNHTYYWGDVHLENMGEERANFISPMKSAYEKGVKFENHTDYMVTPHDQLFTVWTAVNRVSRNGNIIGPDERVSPYIALKSITDWGAYMNFEEDIKGTLTVGKYADMVVLSDNPLKVNPMDIKNIEVQETIKEGKVIYKK